MNGGHTDLISQHRKKLLAVYNEMPSFIREHHGIEQKALAGSYGYRQVMELIQNGADAILEVLEDGLAIEQGNRIHVILRGSRLYVANTGAPLSTDGIQALLSSHSSPKRGNQIGRFGLGFKSLLRLGGCIDLFTRPSGGVRFDPEKCRQEVRAAASEAGFPVTDAPGLRLAWPLTDADRAGDDVLGGLDWAETIVRAEISNAQMLAHIREEIRTFPAEFLLFLSASVVLTLDDGSSPERVLSVKTDGEWRELNMGAETARWRLASTEVEVTDEQATGDATAIHARKKVPLTWAVPADGRREEAGRFWAFFPTETATHIPGILNAPWKVNDARTSIERGEWNATLMRAAAQLIVDTLPKLSLPDDPGFVLEAFPRQLERKDEIAAPLVAEIWSLLKGVNIIPDATGTLRLARDLWLHPRDKPELARQWQPLASPDELSLLVHHSCLERQRNSRLNYLAGELKPATGEPLHPNLRKREAAAWFGAAASGETPKAVEVLKLAEAYKATCTDGEWNPNRPTLAIIPSHDGKLLKAGQVIIAPDGGAIPDRSLVAPAICENAEAKRILVDVMKVKMRDDGVWLDVLRSSLNVPNHPEAECNAGWQGFWTKLRTAPENVRQQIIGERKREIRVRRRDGKWVHSDEVLLPGELVAADDASQNRNVLVDSETHARDETSLAALGVCGFPDGVIGPGSFEEVTRHHDGLDDWLTEWRRYYGREINRRATWGSLKPVGLTLPKGWMFAPMLTGVPSATLTARLLGAIGRGKFTEQLDFKHSSVASYPTIQIPHPLSWFVLKHGSVQVGEKAVRLPAVVAKRREPALVKLPNWNELLPALEKLASAEPSSTPTTQEFRNLWAALSALLATPAALADDSLRDLWTGAANDKFVPDALGEVPLAQVFATGSADLAQRARKTGRIVVTLGDDALKLWLEAGAKDLSKLMTVEKYDSGPADLFVSVLPELAALDAEEAAPLILRREIVSHARCQPVTGLKLNIGDAPEPVPCLMWQGTLLVDAEQLAPLARAERLRLLVNEVAAAVWLNCEPAEALQRLGDAHVDAQRAKVKSVASLPERLWRAVGEREQPLRDALGELAARDFIQQCTALQLAELTIAQLGPATLPALKGTLAAEGLKPPSRWNTVEARAFVASIGFPDEFAASPESQREAEEFISGPIELKELHNFQKEVLEGIQQVIDAGTGRRRGVVCLPTGAGKTRVCVQAAVLLVLAEASTNRSVIWVAQTDELCEQAVQAFRQVWLNLGTQRTDLRIVRLWGGNPNPAGQEPEKPLVVVATIQTLNSRMGRDGLDWLKSPGLVVVDECHHAITPSYTNLLGWLDAMPPRGEQTEKPEPPIFGLSATPFRTDDEESTRLARRFDNRLLPENQIELKQRLLRQGVLAQVDSEALQSGVDLLDGEISQLSALWKQRDGIDFDRLLEDINQRLGGSSTRNERLVQRIQQAEERSILFFANSVQHAVEMSARLNLAGITAAAISGETPTSARRFFLDRFQRGEVRVLVNHSVLTTGFDAPKTDMVFISRQVFSPVRYMQMVGRGLRGLANGGTERCRIVTVLDNLRQFACEHPYHRYWQGYLAEMSGGPPNLT
jgi:superfamily II DNA or RNA helicase